MIVVDTSAIFAILYDEPQAAACEGAMESEPELVISAGTAVEARVVAARSGFSIALEEFFQRIEFVVAPVDSLRAKAVGDAYARWGKGLDRASLNFGDCFAYALAKERGCPLLFIGNDFAQTDITPALR